MFDFIVGFLTPTGHSQKAEALFERHPLVMWSLLAAMGAAVIAILWATS